MPSDPLLPAWGPATLFGLGTDQTYPVPFTPSGRTGRLDFGRELVCELRPHGPELAGDWRFGLHQRLDVPANAPAALRYELRLFIYKPAGAFVSVQLKTTRQVQALSFGPEAVVEGEHGLTATAPLVLAHGGHALWLEVRARREAGAEQVLVTLDSLALAWE